MAYCVASDVATEMGVTFSGAQTTQATDYIVSAQDWIDHYAGRTFEASTAITGERHRIEGPTVYLRKAPMASIQRIRQTYGAVGEPLVTLTSGSDYDVISLTTGELRLALYRYGEVLVDYTPAITVPGRIKRATTLLVAHWMQSSVAGVPAGVEQFGVGGELSVKFADGAVGDIPDEVIRLIGSRRVVIA